MKDINNKQSIRTERKLMANAGGPKLAVDPKLQEIKLDSSKGEDQKSGSD